MVKKKYTTIHELHEKNYLLFSDIEKLIKSKSFPCLFAINSFFKNQLHVYDARSSINLSLDIYQQLSIFSKQIEPIDYKNFNTILIIVPNIPPDHLSIQHFIFSLLIDLKNHQHSCIPLNHNNILESDFEFELDNVIWFPVFLCPNHISKIRAANISIIAFQPKQTFEILKSCPKDFYEKTRTATHKRIDTLYSEGRPFFLSNKSSGINAIQYLGFDPKHPNK